MNKVVVVVGNGFDRDLGLKSDYKSFQESSIFNNYCNQQEIDDLLGYVSTFKHSSLDDKEEMLRFIPCQNIFNVLKIKSKLDNWYDIERFLALIAYNRGHIQGYVDQYTQFLDFVSISEKSFGQLHNALLEYLNSLPYESINLHSVAARLFKVLNEFSTVVQVKSFNYTDWNDMFDGVNKLKVEHIHGSLKDKSIIIGIQDDLDIAPDCNYMIKTFSEHFRSHNLISDLEDADEVIFFGHSLGETDYHYFKDFFLKQTDINKANRNLHVSIFTRDHNSRINILQQIRTMNNKKTDYLFGLCHFNIFMTDPDCNDGKRIDDFLLKLGDRICFE